MKRLALLAVLAATACDSAENANSNEMPQATASPLNEIAAVPLPEATAVSPSPLPPAREAGMFRWSSGTQMGQLWAGVTNKNENALRFFSPGDADWQPDLEVSDQQIRQVLARGRQMNFTLGDKAAVFNYHMENGELALETEGPEGFRELPKLLDMLRSAKGQVICAEFPEAEYRTCFSTNGVAEALGLSTS